MRPKSTLHPRPTNPARVWSRNWRALFAITLSTVFSASGLPVEHQMTSMPKNRNNGSGMFTDDSSVLYPSSSDSLRTAHTELFLDFTAFISKIFPARADISHEVLLSGVQFASIELIPNTIDSITDAAGNHLPFARSGESVSIHVGSLQLNAGDTLITRIYYTGQEQIDQSGWGGLYFSGGIAYNLGVGFDADPHPYGRAWHPCADRFTDRSTYRMHITTLTQHIASAVGSFVDSTHYSDRIEFTYDLPQSIPSYLAGVAVGPYALVRDVFSSIDGSMVPVELFASPSDTNALIASFVHLVDAFNQFEQSYGPYVWSRVGYVLTGQGAMEHPTLVAYPSFLANGNTAYEDVMAHELAHHWWGDYVTCETEEDMWINEGMAEYSAHLFFEEAYDYATYLEKVQANHFDVLNTAHLDDNGYRAVYGIPHAYTYGSHVYYKGASVVHNLRGFLGDSLFFSGITTLLQQEAWTSLSSIDFRDQLSTITGYNLVPFFEHQIFQPGFSTFTVERLDTQVVAPFGGVEVEIQQRLRGTSTYHTDVPLTVSLYFKDHNRVDYQVILSGRDTSMMLPTGILPTPEFAVINPDGQLNLATTYAQGWMKGTGSWPASRTGFQVDVEAIQDSTWAYLAHHWGAPDPATSSAPEFRMSSNHYWEFQCTDTAGLLVSASVLYDGRASNSYLDEDLVSINEDSIQLFYRFDASHNWWPYAAVQKNLIGSNTNRVGRFEISRLIPGQYAFGNMDPQLLSAEQPIAGSFVAYPQPAQNQMQIAQLPNAEYHKYSVHQLDGRLIMKGELSRYNTTIDVSGLKSGTYLLRIDGMSQKISIAR